MFLSSIWLEKLFPTLISEVVSVFEVEGLLLGSKDLTDKREGLGGKVVWYKEAPEAGPLTAGSPDPLALKQDELEDPRTPQMKRNAWGQDGMR